MLRQALDLEERKKITQLLGLSVRAALEGTNLFSQRAFFTAVSKDKLLNFWKDSCDKTELLF